MKKTNNKLVIALLVCLVLISATALVLYKIKDNNNQTISSENNEDTEEPIISEETVKDLKENLGKGTNGDVVKVEESRNDNDEKQYTYIYKDGSTQTITIRNIDDVENIGNVDNKDDSDNKDNGHKDDDNDKKDDEPEETPGTVYERFLLMTPDEQFAFFETFDSQKEYMEWYQAAQAEYLSLHPTIEIGENQVIDFGN